MKRLILLLTVVIAVTLEANPFTATMVCTPGEVLRTDTKAKFVMPVKERKFKYLKVIGDKVYFDGKSYTFVKDDWINVTDGVSSQLGVGKANGKYKVCETNSLEPLSVMMYNCKDSKSVKKKKSSKQVKKEIKTLSKPPVKTGDKTVLKKNTPVKETNVEQKDNEGYDNSLWTTKTLEQMKKEDSGDTESEVIKIEDGNSTGKVDSSLWEESKKVWGKVWK